MVTNATKTLFSSDPDYMTFAGDSITIITPGAYFLQFAIDGTGVSAADRFDFSLYKNGVAVAGTPSVKGTSPSIQWFWYLEDLIAGDDLRMMVTNTVNGNNLTLEDGAIFIEKKHN